MMKKLLRRTLMICFSIILLGCGDGASNIYVGLEVQKGDKMIISTKDFYIVSECTGSTKVLGDPIWGNKRVVSKKDSLAVRELFR